MTVNVEISNACFFCPERTKSFSLILELVTGKFGAGHNQIIYFGLRLFFWTGVTRGTVRRVLCEQCS